MVCDTVLLQASLNTFFFACLLQHGGSFGSSEVVANHNAPILDCHAPTPNFDISGEHAILALLLSLPHTALPSAVSACKAEQRSAWVQHHRRTGHPGHPSLAMTPRLSLCMTLRVLPLVLVLM